MNCPKHEDVELEFVSGDYSTGVVAPDGYAETRYEEGFHCYRCNVTYDPSDLEDEPEPAVCDPDHLNPSEGGNKAGDDYW